MALRPRLLPGVPLSLAMLWNRESVPLGTGAVKDGRLIAARRSLFGTSPRTLLLAG